MTLHSPVDVIVQKDCDMEAILQKCSEETHIYSIHSFFKNKLNLL